MWRILLSCHISFSLLVSSGMAMEIFSVSPGDIFPGSEIIVQGADLEPNAAIVLGKNVLRPLLIDKTTAKALVPTDIEPGTYRLVIKTKTTSSPAISITVKKREISVKSYSPDIIDICNPNVRFVINGGNLSGIKKITVNGQEVTGVVSTATSIAFDLTEEMVRNNPYVASVALYDETLKIQDLINIRVNSAPQVTGIEIINTGVTSYEIKITGKNLLAGMKLLINGSLVPEKSGKNTPAQLPSLHRTAVNTPINDFFRYSSCTELYYTRYPFSSEVQKIDVLIENPGGEKSNAFSFIAP